MATGAMHSEIHQCCNVREESTDELNAISDIKTRTAQRGWIGLAAELLFTTRYLFSMNRVVAYN